VLIVCEGTKTEPTYFRDFVEAFRLSSANVVVVSGRRSDPLAVAQTAVRQYEDDPDYDAVYVVLDQDVPTYDRAAKYVAGFRKSGGHEADLAGKLALVPSMPCFEYWLLLHYEDSARAYGAGSKRSPCAECERDLKRHLPNYTKSADGVFEATRAFLDEATARANRRAALVDQAAAPNPVTYVFELTNKLRTLRG
jgi:hypothetical protein